MKFIADQCFRNSLWTYVEKNVIYPMTKVLERQTFCPNKSCYDLHIIQFYDIFNMINILACCKPIVLIVGHSESFQWIGARICFLESFFVFLALGFKNSRLLTRSTCLTGNYILICPCSQVIFE